MKSYIIYIVEILIIALVIGALYSLTSGFKVFDLKSLAMNAENIVKEIKK